MVEKSRIPLTEAWTLYRECLGLLKPMIIDEIWDELKTLFRRWPRRPKRGHRQRRALPMYYMIS